MAPIPQTMPMMVMPQITYVMPTSIIYIQPQTIFPQTGPVFDPRSLPFNMNQQI